MHSTHSALETVRDCPAAHASVARKRSQIQCCLQNVPQPHHDTGAASRLTLKRSRADREPQRAATQVAIAALSGTYG